MEPWIEKDKRRGTRRVRWWKKLGGKWVKDKGIACGKDYSYAQDVKEKVRLGLRADSLGEVDLTRNTMECFEAFLHDRKLNNYPENTLKTYRDSITPFLTYVPTVTELADPQKLKDFKTHMLTPGSNKLHSTKEKPVPMAASTIRRRLMDVRVWLNWCVANGWLKESPWRHLTDPSKKMRFLPKQKSVARFYTDEEIRSIEEAIQTPFWKNDTEKVEQEKKDSAEFLCMWRMCYDAAMREGEICKARFEDIQRIEGGEGLITIKSRKGTHDEEKIRVIVLSEKIMQSLPDGVMGYIFPTWVLPNGEPDYVKTRWHWGKAREKAQLSRAPGLPPATFYQGRHSFCRKYLEAGGDLRDLKEILGHSSMRMIDEVYGHIRASVVHARMRAAQRLAGQWRGKIALDEVNSVNAGSRPIISTGDEKKYNDAGN